MVRDTDICCSQIRQGFGHPSPNLLTVLQWKFAKTNPRASISFSLMRQMMKTAWIITLWRNRGNRSRSCSKHWPTHTAAACRIKEIHWRRLAENLRRCDEFGWRYIWTIRFCHQKHVVPTTWFCDTRIDTALGESTRQGWWHKRRLNKIMAVRFYRISFTVVSLRQWK